MESKNISQTKFQTEISKPRPVSIRPYQVNHYKRIINILMKEYAYLDVSPFGSGKTHMVYAVAATFKLNVLVVGPSSTLNNWRKWAKIYGVNLIRAITYQSLRGNNDNLNHPFLKRKKGVYEITELFTEYVRSGLLLVFDEYHNLKNNNSQLASSHTLVKEVVRLVSMGYKSRIALLSGTPCDMKEYVTSTFKMLGIILSDKLYNYNRSTKNYELLGIQEAIDKCKHYDLNRTIEISCRPINKTTAKTICHELYLKILKKYIVSSMPRPPIESEVETKNYYILMPSNDIDRLRKGLTMFKSATNYQEDIKEVNLSGVNWGDVTTSRMEIDSAKIPSVCRLARNDLEKNSNCKVLIYCNYLRDIKTAYELLKDYNPMVMDGSVNPTNRLKITKAFQEDNNNYRVIISNPRVGGIGIDLDDKHGNRPRIMYILPSYFFTDQYQATGRIYRSGTKSKATIYFVYSRKMPYETGIFNSMASKSKIVKDMIEAEHKSIRFPSEYEEKVELTQKEIKENGRQQE